MRGAVLQRARFGAIAFADARGILRPRDSVANIGNRRFMKRLIAQIMKFGVVGVIAFVIDYGLLVLLTSVCGINYLVSATISFTVSVVFNYVASMRYVFKHKEGMSKRREFVIFVVLSVIGLIINDAAMWAGTGLLGIDYRITKIVATAIVMVWNFVTRKIFLDAGDDDAADADPIVD